MINSRSSRDTKSFVSFDFKNEIFKRDFERFKKIIKNKTFVNSRSFRRDSENVETKSQHFVIHSMSFIIFAFFVTFVSTFFVIVVSIFFVIVIFAFSITLSFVFAFFDESIVNLMFEKMNRDVLVRFLTILIFFFRWFHECVCCRFDFDSNYNFCDWFFHHVRLWIYYRDWFWKFERYTR
jgi:hypothetical protein